MQRIVTQQDIEPDGWMCESCPHVFIVGETAYGVITTDIEDGTRVLDHWQCESCYRMNASILPASGVYVRLRGQRFDMVCKTLKTKI